MSNPSVTVVIPAFRAAGTIARPIESALAQTCPPAEILVVDDGSPDDLAGALRPYGSQVRLHRKVNGGAASARNAGIEIARGEWVAFLDADDYWEPAKLEMQLKVARALPAAVVIGSRWFEEQPGCPRELAPVKDESYFGRLIGAERSGAFRVAMNMWTSATLINREALVSNRFVPGLEPAEDKDLWIRLASKNAVFLLPEPLATYVQEPGSLSRTNVDRDCGNMLRVVRRHRDILGAELRAQEADVFRRWAGGHLVSGHAKAAIAPAYKRLTRDPLSLEAWWIISKSLMKVAGKATFGRHARSASKQAL